MEAKVYNQKGESVGKVALPENVFGVPFRSDLVHQVVEGMRSNARAPFAHTLGRGEVRGGGKKPWKQKGTGRARHGSTRSPIWVGGGVAHGPKKDKNFKKKISKSMRAQALFSVLSKKFKAGQIIFVDSLAQKEMKTKQGVAVVASLAKATGWKEITTHKKPKALVALFEKSKNTEKTFKNIPSLDLTLVQNLNPLDVLNHKYLLMENPEASVKFFASRA